MKSLISVRLVCAIVMAAMCAAATGQRPVGATHENAPAAEAFRVLPPADAEGPQITPYLLYQTQLAWDQDALRRERWSQVKSEGDLLRLRAELKKSLLEMIGGLPVEKADLHATITGRIAGNGFHIEKLIYQSIPGFYVTALVYVPENGDKVHPAILVPAGHAANGKDHYEALCQRRPCADISSSAGTPSGKANEVSSGMQRQRRAVTT